MRAMLFRAAVLMAVLITGMLPHTAAQPTQIPGTQIPNKSEAKGQKFLVTITSRSDMTHAGKVGVELQLNYVPVTTPYPTGFVNLDVDLTDSLRCTVVSTTVEQVTSYGRATPTMIVSGRCDVRPKDQDAKIQRPIGCRYWVLLADNEKEPASNQTKRTPDVVSFFVEDFAGKRLAYGTGTISEGNLTVEPNN